MGSEQKNARIRSTRLGVEDHGILTAYIDLDYGGSGQAFGGYAFDAPVKVNGEFSHREGTAYGMEFIRRVLVTLGVESWEKLPGTPIRVRASRAQVEAIGHFIEDRWFDPSSIRPPSPNPEEE